MLSGGITEYENGCSADLQSAVTPTCGRHPADRRHCERTTKAMGHSSAPQIANLRYSTARPSRNRIARSVWSAAYPAALVVADEFVMHAPCELGNEKRRDTPHSKRFATSQLASGIGLVKCAVNSLVRLHKKSS